MFSLKNLFLLVILGLSAWALVPPAEKAAAPAPSSSDSSSADPSFSSSPVSSSSASRKHVIRVGPKLFYMPGNVPMGVGRPLEGLRKVAERYEALHPDTKIEYVAVPAAREWLVTQVAAGIAPDIVDVNVEEVWGDTHKGWYIPLDEFLDRPSAYARPGEPGSARWWDVMKYPAISRSTVGPDGRYYCVVYDLVETGIFYNREIFRKAGVAPPADWADFLRVQEKLRAAGYIPLVAPITNLADWGTDLLFDQFYQEILPILDLKPEAEELRQFRDGYLDWDEIAFLHGQGFFTRKDERFVSIWRTMKEWRRHMSPDISDTGTDYVKLFLTQKAAMYWSGSWMVHQFRNDPAMEFEWGVFYPPAIPRSYNRYANGHPMVVIGGPGTQWVITRSAIRDTGTSATSEHLRRCIDFLQFLTTPESSAAVVNEVSVFMPNTVGVEARPELKEFDEFLRRRSSISKWQFTFDMKFNDVMVRMLELYLNGGVTEEEYLDWMERNLDAAVKNAVRRQKPDLSVYETRWKELAPRRAALEGLPDGAR